MIEEYNGFQIKPSKQMPSSLIVATAGLGGSIPKALEGLFTSYPIAKAQIDAYLETKVTDAKAVNKSRGK